MYIRIFAATQDTGLAKFFRLVGAQDKHWTIEHCSPVHWGLQEPSAVADIHLYLDEPLRVAMPWARYNVFATEVPTYRPWAWTRTEMDLVLPREEFERRDRTLSAVRRILRGAAASKNVPLAAQVGSSTPVGVAIVTLTRNRARWWKNMVQNVLTQDWLTDHRDTTEWILVDDSDKPLTTEVAEFKGLRVKHVVLDKPTSIGEKRNIAVREASPGVTVFVTMDDDDHYPPTSVSKRIAWIARAPVVYCSVLPMYDIRRYISAINVPPLADAPEDRVSEATLAFTRKAWTERPFEDSWMAEGAPFVVDRENAVDVPPTGIIVSFIHTGNSSSRRVPEDTEPNGSHYGFSDAFFRYLHEVAGV